MTPHHPDLALAHRARDGDEAAWREIYDATRDRLFGLLAYQCGDRDEARDLLQETYLAAWRGLAAYRGESRLESWLIGIALRRARDWKRRFLPWQKRSVDLADVQERLVTPLADDAPIGARLRRALAHLPERQRSAFLLHEWLGYPFDEISRPLGISAATARVHCHRARLALRLELADDNDPAFAGRLRESES